jgi:polysaccharide export outer membrane protein
MNLNNRSAIMNRIAALIALLCIAAGLTFAQTVPAKEKQDKAKAAPEMVAAASDDKTKNSDEYVIGPDDVLSIVVWKEPDFTKTVPVRPDGMISIALAGDIRAAGLTVRQLQENLKKQLTAFVANPEVSITVQEFRSQKFNVMGQVNKPGAYPLTGPTRILDAIALAGGFRDFAKTKKIYVLRATADGKQVKLPFNYNEVIKGNQMNTNVELESRDTIVVP